MELSRVAKAMPRPSGAFRALFVKFARICFLLLSVFWAIEALYWISSYRSGGWPAVLGYLQGISQGHNPTPVSGSMTVVAHLLLLSLTVALAWLLRATMPIAGRKDVVK